MTTDMHELAADELDCVNGAAIVEFAIGPAKFQFATDGRWTFWNGRNWVGDHES